MTAVTREGPTGQAPAVSVAVISYNAAATIEETLDSIMRQDHGAERIDLVISDDGSSDDTVAVTRRWIERNGGAFWRIEAIANRSNGGVSRNCNVAWKACRGEWIKTIAADDILLPNCLSANLAFASERDDCDIVVSKMRWFGSIQRVTPEPSQIALFDLGALDQYKSLRFGSFNFAPTVFMRRQALEAVGYADERFRNIEDLPLWLKFTKRGHRLFFNDCVTVEYRVADSISKSTSRFVNVPFVLDLIAIHEQQTPLDSDGPVYRYLHLERSIGLHSTLLISRLCGNRRSWFSRSLEFLALLLRPTDLWGALRRRIGRLTGRIEVARS